MRFPIHIATDKTIGRGVVSPLQKRAAQKLTECVLNNSSVRTGH